VTAFRLPLPPSANDLVRPAVMYTGKDRAIRALIEKLQRSGQLIVRLVATPEARDFRVEAHAKLPRAPVAGPVELYATVTVATIASDANNREKALSDALNGRLWWDDKQIAETHIVKRIAAEPAQVGCVVEVRPADVGEHAELSRRLSKSKVQELANDAAQGRLFNATPSYIPPPEDAFE